VSHHADAEPAQHPFAAFTGGTHSQDNGFVRHVRQNAAAL
jgi:hypothetical protein